MNASFHSNSIKRLAASGLLRFAVRQIPATLLFCSSLLLSLHAQLAADGSATNAALHRFDGIWAADVPTAGFRRNVQEAGVAVGLAVAPSNGRDPSTHYLELTKIYYGWMLGDTMGQSHWWRGNWELLEEIFAGEQSYPKSRYEVGETTVLRYNFITGTRWVPFIDGGFGAMGTDIGHPNLGSTFEFNEYAGAGVDYFWRTNSALSLQYRFTHVSDGGIAAPNGGLNQHILYAGLSWFF